MPSLKDLKENLNKFINRLRGRRQEQDYNFDYLFNDDDLDDEVPLPEGFLHRDSLDDAEQRGLPRRDARQQELRETIHAEIRGLNPEEIPEAQIANDDGALNVNQVRELLDNLNGGVYNNKDGMHSSLPNANNGRRR